MHLDLVRLENTFQKSSLIRIEDNILAQFQVELWIKRDDLLHPVISGNKWRKLKYILDYILQSDITTVTSMGGAYSNHLHTLAYLGQALGFRTIGYIRGEQPLVLNPTLCDMQRWGMEFRFVSKNDYKNLRLYKNFDDLPGLPTNHYWLPEGGAQSLALKGVAELVDELDMAFDTLCVPCGTGTTAAGIVSRENRKFDVIGFSALKNADSLLSEIEFLLKNKATGLTIQNDYHFGGFAKTSKELFDFIKEFERTTSVTLEPIYTGKMFYGLYDLITKRFFSPGHRIVALHTGGLQGNRGFNQILSA